LEKYCGIYEGSIFRVASYMGCMLVGVFLIVVTEESMRLFVLSMLFVFYAMLKDHDSPLRRDMEGSNPFYANRLRFVIKLSKLI
jgi:hypothetical protein